MRRMFFKTISWVSIGIGSFLLVQIALPLVAFYFWEHFSYSEQSLISPTQSSKKILGVSVTAEGFKSQNIDSSSSINHFELSVPSLELNNIPVDANSNNFDINLAHLPGSALPGEVGNVFITGHSSVPIFPFNQKKETYFKNLNQVKKGDQIIIRVQNSLYNYQVLGLTIVDPHNTSVLNPPDNVGRYLSLMTCVPPGFNTKRLIVLAELI